MTRKAHYTIAELDAAIRGCAYPGAAHCAIAELDAAIRVLRASPLHQVAADHLANACILRKKAEEAHTSPTD